VTPSLRNKKSTDNVARLVLTV